LIYTETNNEPLVSVIIPCYNHGRYLANAINSIYAQQGYANYEIVIVDDGSVDETKAVVASFSEVKYIHQQNAGLSAARNTGIVNSSGKYLIFLDADDWLMQDAIRVNLSYLDSNPDIAFVSGAHVKVIESSNTVEEKKTIVERDHYKRLLEGNFIAMHATVMYRRWVFDKFRYDESLQAFEDYDLYLNITRKYKMVHHQNLIAAYRIHSLNMSNNMPLMLSYAIKVLKRQKNKLENELERKSYKVGLKYWKDYYSGGLYRYLAKEPWDSVKKRKGELRMLFNNNILLYCKLLLKKLINAG